jgi:hypothetical protein
LRKLLIDKKDGTYAERVAADVSGYATGKGDLTTDAWGVQKVSLPQSVFHGLFTFDIPQSQWFMYHGQTQVYTSTNITSSNGAALVQANAAQPDVKLESRATPRYQPNRGHLYSTALWLPSASANAIRDFGLSTPENGVYFRLKSTGLYAVLKSGLNETREELIDTSAVAGFDVTKGNVYDIQYQWRGVGNYLFFINLQHVHTFANLGTLTALSLQDPALPAMYRAIRITADAAMYIGCVDIASENGSDDRLQYASVYADVSLNGTNQPLIVIHNPLVIGLTTNTRMTELSRITLTCDKKAIFKVWTTRNPAAITGATLVSIGDGSFVQCDSPDAVAGAVKATSVNTALLHLVTVIPVQAGISRATDNPFQGRIDFPLVRGDYLVITADVTTGTCDVVVEWGEAI